MSMSDDTGLARHTSISVLWMTAQRWVTRLGGFLTIIILTRILSPEDFGVAATATTLLPLIYVLADAGFSAYLVQADDVDERTLATAFWFSLGSGLLLAGAIAVAAPFIGSALGVPEAAPLLQIMGLSVLAVALGSVPVALLRRKMEFRKLALLEANAALIAQIVAIAVALTGGGAWALVLQVLCGQLIVLTSVWIAARWRPHPGFSFARFKVMVDFGLHVVGSGLVYALRVWAETAIVVAGLGVREMGYLSIAQRLVQTAQDLSISALLPVSMAAFAKIRDSVDRLRHAYLRASSVAYAVITPLMVFLAVAAPEVVQLLFGADKADSAHVVPALAVMAIAGVGWAVDQALLVGTGHPGRWFAFIATIYSLALLVSLYLVQFGLMAVVIGWATIATVEALLRSIPVAPVIGATRWQVVLPFIGVVPTALIAGAVGWGVLYLADPLPLVVEIFLGGAAVGITYLLALAVLRPQTTATVLSVLPGRIAGPARAVLGRRVRGA